MEYNNYTHDKLQEAIREYKKARLELIFISIQCILKLIFMQIHWLFVQHKYPKTIDDKINLKKTMKDCCQTISKRTSEIIREKKYSLRLRWYSNIAWLRRKCLTYNVRMTLHSINEVFQHESVKKTLIILYA